MSEPLKVVLVAAESAGTQVLRGIVNAGYTLAGLLTGNGDGNGMRAVADGLGCPVWPANAVRDPAFAERLKSDGVDVLLNVHSLFVIRKEILAAPRIGSFNMHPGPLPECAGLNAVSWALYEGQSTHAVTIHWMVPEIDAGAVAYEARFDVEERDTALSMSVKSVRAGVPLVERLLATAATNPAAIPASGQDLSRRRYHGREIPQGGRLDWSRPAREVVNFVRACDYLPWVSPWGHPKSVFRHRDVAVLKAARTGMPSDALPGTVGPIAERGVQVSAADEWVLVRRLLSDGCSVEARELLDSGGRFDGTLS